MWTPPAGSRRFSGIPRFIVGATIVSVATTLPELFVSSIAASKGQAEMAIGNAIGSVTANTALIMALSMVFLPVTLKRKDYLFKSVLLMGTVALLWALCGDGTLPVARGVIMFVVFALFIWENVKAAKKEDANEPEEKPEKPTRQTVLKNIVLFVLGAAGIVIGSDLLVDNGTLLAQRLGVPENVVALTAVAIGTSLPELVTAITSIVKKEASLSVGNVIGANIIDTALILPVCSVISGGTLRGSRLDRPRRHAGVPGRDHDRADSRAHLAALPPLAGRAADRHLHRLSGGRVPLIPLGRLNLHPLAAGWQCRLPLAAGRLSLHPAAAAG